VLDRAEPSGARRLTVSNPAEGTSAAELQARFSTSDEITDALADEARGMVGVPLRLEQWNTEAARDNIRHYALGIGDLNPLWLDADYGLQSVHGTTLAPPTFLYSVYCGLAPGLGGLPALLTGAHWRFFDWVRLGDELRAAATIDDVEVVENRRSEKRIVQHGRLEYFRVRGSGPEVKVAECRQQVVRTPGPGRTGALKHAPRPPHRYSDEELDEIERAVLQVRPRGRYPRAWEDVRSGAALEQVVKGPYTRMTMVSYYAGAPGSPGYRAFDAWWRNRALAGENPEALPNTFPPEYFAGTGVTSMGHHDAEAAQTIGMPGVYDNGNQRIGLMATVLTNWIGDAGAISEYEHEILRPVTLGDTLYIDGTVVSKEPAASTEGEVTGCDPAAFGRVDIRLQARNQLDEVVSVGGARVLLPRRESSDTVDAPEHGANHLHDGVEP
jgi:acyl dehydratase